jgi:acylphosphatase
MIVCKRVHYSGRVQGVGFRYTTRSLADRFAVAGYVRNLANGEVELVAEGEADEVERFLAALASRMEHYIEHSRMEELPRGGYRDFRIRH